MATFNVYRNPTTGGLEAVKQGYCVPILLLNILIPLGWIWAFLNHAPHFAWRLLSISIILGIITLLFPNFILLISLLWLVFSVGLGGMANKQIEYSLRRRGFTLIQDGVLASSTDTAIEEAAKVA